MKVYVSCVDIGIEIQAWTAQLNSSVLSYHLNVANDSGMMAGTKVHKGSCTVFNNLTFDWRWKITSFSSVHLNVQGTLPVVKQLLGFQLQLLIVPNVC